METRLHEAEATGPLYAPESHYDTDDDDINTLTTDIHDKDPLKRFSTLLQHAKHNEARPAPRA
jgi:hypothetical protein